MNDSMERRAKPEGGFCLISVGEILRCWAAYREGPIEFRDLRVWFAAHELVARRCRLAKGRLASYRLEELAGLVSGVGGEHFRSSIRKLEASKLISWTSSAITFPKVEGGDRKDRRLIPVPRRTLRFLAGCGKPVLDATILGHLIRCVFYRNGECVSKGTCKASWVAEVFGVNVRGVKRARKELSEMGWLEIASSPHWHRQRYGGTTVVNLGWSLQSDDGAEDCKLPPRMDFPTTELPPLESNKELLTESRYQKLDGEPSGVKKQEPGRPTISNIRLEDLVQFSRCEELYRQAVDRGLIQHSENQVLNWIGAAVRAKAVAGDPVRVFAGIVRKGLYRHVTQEQEERARMALVRYREVKPGYFRV